MTAAQRLGAAAPAIRALTQPPGIMGWCFLFYTLVTWTAYGEFLLDILRAWSWRHSEDQAKADWTGGTDECLVVGGLLGRGPILRPREWEQHYAQTLPQ